LNFGLFSYIVDFDLHIANFGRRLLPYELGLVPRVHGGRQTGSPPRGFPIGMRSV